jgi:hypothetical protein
MKNSIYTTTSLLEQYYPSAVIDMTESVTLSGLLRYTSVCITFDDETIVISADGSIATYK